MQRIPRGGHRPACSARACCAVLSLVLLSLGAAARADILYGTSVDGSFLFRADTSTASVTTILNTLSGADSLVFDTTGRIIYSQIYSGSVRRYDPFASTDVLIASGLQLPADLALEPGGGSVLVSEYGGGVIDRINLTTLASSQLSTGLINPEGTVYDSSGRLFANIGNRYGGPTGKQLVQLDPVTGAVLASSPGLDSLDGLTYDAFSGRLYATSLFGGGIYSVDPNNLGAAPLQLAWGGLQMPDGITTNGTGQLFIAAAGNDTIYQYDLASSTLAPKVYVYGLDDLAPASGLGSNQVPEPGALGFAAAGLMGGLAWWRRRQEV
jgi:streptogramin lyase